MERSGVNNVMLLCSRAGCIAAKRSGSSIISGGKGWNVENKRSGKKNGEGYIYTVFLLCFGYLCSGLRRLFFRIVR